jgi:hypothetical protein
LYRAVRNAGLNARRNGLREAPLDAANCWFVHRGGDREAALSLQIRIITASRCSSGNSSSAAWSGMTLEEIAVATGVSLNTAASRYRYALEKLREGLKPEGKV